MTSFRLSRKEMYETRWHRITKTIGDRGAARHRRVYCRGRTGVQAICRRQGRTSDDEIIIFDSTGMALQDVAAAAIVYERAVSVGAGAVIHLGH